MTTYFFKGKSNFFVGYVVTLIVVVNIAGLVVMVVSTSVIIEAADPDQK